MKLFIANLKIQAAENPLFAVVIISSALSVLVKLMDSGNARRNSRAWAKEVDRRSKL
jgi:hypothetical protein